MKISIIFDYKILERENQKFEFKFRIIVSNQRLIKKLNRNYRKGINLFK